jgi:hypothetical protein
MTDKDKQLIAEYMGLFFDNDAGLYFGKDDDGDPFMFHFDSNDASLCVEKMVEKGNWHNFVYKATQNYMGAYWADLIGTIFMSPDNFFSAMASWLRSKK